LIKQQPKFWKNRVHFFAVAALSMRQILVDHARRRLAVKRGEVKCIEPDDVGVFKTRVRRSIRTVRGSRCA
jgi:hypothetical protein